MFEIKKTNAGRYWWHLKAENGEILCHSEEYTTKQSAQNGITAVKRITPTAVIKDLT